MSFSVHIGSCSPFLFCQLMAISCAIQSHDSRNYVASWAKMAFRTSKSASAHENAPNSVVFKLLGHVRYSYHRQNVYDPLWFPPQIVLLLPSVILMAVKICIPCHQCAICRTRMYVCVHQSIASMLHNEGVKQTDPVSADVPNGPTLWSHAVVA